MEGLIFGGAYQRREISGSKSIGLALQLEVNLPFWLCCTLYLRAIFQVQAPRGLFLEGRFNGGFFALAVWGAYIWSGLYMEGLIFGILRYQCKAGGGGGVGRGRAWVDIFQKFAVKFPAHGQIIPVKCNQISPPRAAHCCQISQGWTQERHNKNISK